MKHLTAIVFAPLLLAISSVHARPDAPPITPLWSQLLTLEPNDRALDASSQPRKRSWELPRVTVEAEPGSTLKEEDRVGSYAQPRWTATRRFPSTRVYVVPEGKIETELWSRQTFTRDGGTEHRFLQELEIGLPHRFQLDLYLRQDYDTKGDDRHLLWGGQFEVRWALADWGKIWGNPTLYFEYITLEKRPDKIEPKLLLGGEIAPEWHWGANLVGEFELGGEREYEYALTTAISKTVIDSTLSIGVESVLSLTNVAGERGHTNASLVIGPSLQWKPIEPMTLNIAPLVGVTGHSPRAQVYINLGWEF